MKKLIVRAAVRIFEYSLLWIWLGCLGAGLVLVATVNPDVATSPDASLVLQLRYFGGRLLLLLATLIPSLVLILYWKGRK